MFFSSGHADSKVCVQELSEVAIKAMQAGTGSLFRGPAYLGAMIGLPAVCCHVVACERYHMRQVSEHHIRASQHQCYAPNTCTSATF